MPKRENVIIYEDWEEVVEDVVDTVTLEQILLEYANVIDVTDEIARLYSPEDVFSFNELKDWAYENGFIEDN